MARLPMVARDMVPEQFRDAFDQLTADSGGMITTGPGSITINSPEMALRRAPLTAYLRFESTFSKRIQELAIITTARAMDCQYVWNAQAAAARRAGVGDALVDAIRDKAQLPAMSAEEAALVTYGMELTATNQVSEETFSAARDQLGVKGLVEFTTNMGYYRMISLNANACTIELPDDMTEPLLPI